MKRKCKHVYFPEFLHGDGKTTGHCEKCGIPMWRKNKVKPNAVEKQDKEPLKEQEEE